MNVRTSPASIPSSDPEARRLVTGLSLLVLLAALLDLLGWWLRIPRLTTVIHNDASMKPNTAACLGLLAIALLLTPRPASETPLWRRSAAILPASLALLVSALTLLEYLTPPHLPIDQILAAVPPDRFLDPAGRMSLGSSVFLVLTTSAFLLRDRLFPVSAAFTLLGLILSVSGLLGFVFQAGPLLHVRWVRSISVHTVVALALLQVANLASRPHRQPFFSLSQHWRTENRRRYLLFALTVLPIFLALPVLAGLRSGIYDAPFALALLLVLLISLQTFILWADNRTLGRVEAQLRQAEQYSTRILESIGDGVIVTDHQGSITRMNDLAESLTGWRLADALHLPLADVFNLFHEGTHHPIENPFETVRRLGTVVALPEHTVLRHRSGSDIHIEDSSSPIRDDSGQLCGMVLIFRDVEQRSSAQRLARTADERLQLALETAPLGPWEIDLADVSLHASPGCKANFGLTPDQPLLYTDALRAVHPDDLHMVRTAIRDSIESLGTYRIEYRVIWPDGSLHWLIGTGRTLADHNGGAVRLVGVTLDVTERHQAAQALIQSEKLAAVGRLASSIAHEINNPLESVTNLVYLARHTAVDPDIQDYLDTAERELRRVSAISSQTLRFYKQSTNPRLADPLEILNSVLSIYQGKLVHAGVHVQIRARARNPLFCFDGEIRQVLGNLIGNAIDAMAAHRGGRLLLRTRSAHHPQSGVSGTVLTIADTGCGIPARTLEKIFQPFFTTKGIAGTGLGLWISDEIIRRHHGSLNVRSRQQTGASGTVFTVFLPTNAALRSAPAGPLAHPPLAAPHLASSIPA